MICPGVQLSLTMGFIWGTNGDTVHQTVQLKKVNTKILACCDYVDMPWERIITCVLHPPSLLLITDEAQTDSISQIHN